MNVNLLSEQLLKFCRLYEYALHRLFRKLQPDAQTDSRRRLQQKADKVQWVRVYCAGLGLGRSIQVCRPFSFFFIKLHF